MRSSGSKWGIIKLIIIVLIIIIRRNKFSDTAFQKVHKLHMYVCVCVSASLSLTFKIKADISYNARLKCFFDVVPRQNLMNSTFLFLFLLFMSHFTFSPTQTYGLLTIGMLF